MTCLKVFEPSDWGPEWHQYIDTNKTFFECLASVPPPDDCDPSADEWRRAKLLAKQRTPQVLGEVRHQWDGFLAEFSTLVEQDKVASLADAQSCMARLNFYTFPPLVSLTMTAKDRFSRARSWQYEPDFPIVAPPKYRRSPSNPSAEGLAPPTHPAYPSGHATVAYCFAGVLAKVVSAHANAAILRTHLFDAAEKIAVNREIAGVHFFTETQAGANLGRCASQLIVTDHKDWIGDLRNILHL